MLLDFAWLDVSGDSAEDRAFMSLNDGLSGEPGTHTFGSRASFIESADEKETEFLNDDPPKPCVPSDAAFAKGEPCDGCHVLNCY